MLGDYENSAGSAMEEAMKSANNWEGSLNRLSNTWTDIVGNIANSDGIITGINSLNGLLEIINKITSALGTLGTLGLGVGIFAGAKGLNGSGRDKCFLSIMNVPLGSLAVMCTSYVLA